MSCIPVHHKDKQIFYKCVLIVLWIFFFIFVGEELHRTIKNKIIDWSVWGSNLWLLHACSILTLVANSQMNDKSLMNILVDMNKKDTSAIIREITSTAARDDIGGEKSFKDLKYVSDLVSGAAIIFALLNMAVVYIQLINGFLYAQLPWSHGPLFILFGCILWYFYSFGWSMPLPFIVIPCYCLVRRVEEFVTYIESEESVLVERLNDVMDWRDEVSE